ncbi:MAG: hypothetical protein F2607_05445 [Actinobacteria bacterium]|uniref:Unannotated protein n=1 Tax=freshwater metagenome TaxID=449393 RepID=A0A6J6JK02_9ZZZZ|nr:hypothetical protein [Actinomycetota bacterium]
MNAPSPKAKQRGFRRLRRVLVMLGFVLGIVAVSAGCMPELLIPATSGRTYGQGPLDSIREAADRTTTLKLSGTDQPDPNYNCGLSSADLAAMMMVPTYFEAGGSVPSPMTLSRWDNVSVSSSNANLFAFGRTSGAYVNAFFSPGIGLWQFDSAGYWDMTAADAINTSTAANQASLTIAYRWCNAWRSGKAATPQMQRQYAWGPWFGCSSVNISSCEDTFKQLVTQDGKLNTAFDAAVSRTGGMQKRTCNLRGIGDGLTCFYINPALAEGSRGWQGGTYDPARPNYVTPLPKPFYSVRANGNEYRVWLKEDTGYDIDITASKLVTANARASLTWTASTGLCDTTNRHGYCGNVDPVGSFDGVWQSGPGQIRVAGWALDLDTTNPIDVHIYAGTLGAAIEANLARPDIGAIYAGSGNSHGFDAVVPSPIGVQQVCAYGVNVAGGSNALLGCRTVNVTGVPIGSIDGFSSKPGSIIVTGWAAVPGDPAATANITIDGVIAAQLPRNVPRGDVASLFPWAGTTAGYWAEVPLVGGTHTVCLTAGGAAPNALGCRTVNMPTGSPFGSLDMAVARPGTINVSGWVIDPDIAGPTDVHVWIGSSGTAVRSDLWRSDVGAAFPVYGSSHGFNATIPVSGGPQTVCVYGFNQGGGSNSLLGCRQLNVLGGSPIGSLDAVARTPNGVVVAGWALDPDTAASIPVHVYVGPVGTAITANLWRSDVGALFSGYGNSHGFWAMLPVPTTPVQVCVYAVEAAGTGLNQLLGCRVV